MATTNAERCSKIFNPDHVENVYRDGQPATLAWYGNTRQALLNKDHQDPPTLFCDYIIALHDKGYESTLNLIRRWWKYFVSGADKRMLQQKATGTLPEAVADMFPNQLILRVTLAILENKPIPTE